MFDATVKVIGRLTLLLRLWMFDTTVKVMYV